jgi:hypothetical protein
LLRAPTAGCQFRPLGDALIEADISRYKRVVGGALRSRTEQRRATEVGQS